MSDLTYPVYPVFAFIGFVIVLIPLPWHLQAWNSGTCLFMIWTALGCLNLFINTIVWHNNMIDWSPVWCDISSRIVIAVSVGIPASSLCINRRLYNIATCQTVSMTKALKRRAVMIDLAIALGLPLLQLPLQFIVQGHRYDILEDIGCYPTTYNTVPAYPLIFLWPNVMNVVSGTYSILTIRAFMKRRAQFNQFLSSNAALTANRYFRLMALATIELVCNTPISSYGLYLNVTQSPIQPWISWANTHFDFFTIEQVPAIFWRANHNSVVAIELSRWSQIFCAFLFFGFFGFAAEARKHYRLAFWAVATRCGVQRPADGKLPIALPWSKTKSSTPSAAALQAVSLPRTPAKRRPDSLSPSLADTSTDFDDTDAGLEKGKSSYLLPTPSSGSSPPEYVHDIELGAYATTRSESLSSSTRSRPFVADAFFPAHPSPPARPSAPSPRSPRPETWPSLHSPAS
ncbi:pheromone receptor Rcb3 B45 [Mycena belliarum]|uniref:Pheromone receptor Rcb3 B45 n=1 Tax=Mycena belliarum TaxID=1033014 RepID=A0AAD6U048_9AGAR|nr:pheromone receptor Rcb3 B45 [Mycena belliae]